MDKAEMELRPSLIYEATQAAIGVTIAVMMSSSFPRHSTGRMWLCTRALRVLRARKRTKQRKLSGPGRSTAELAANHSRASGMVRSRH